MLSLSSLGVQNFNWEYSFFQ